MLGQRIGIYLSIILFIDLLMISLIFYEMYKTWCRKFSQRGDEWLRSKK